MEGNGELDQQWSAMESLIKLQGRENATMECNGEVDQQATGERECNKLQGRGKRFQKFCCKSLGGKSDLQQVFRWLGERRERGAHEICPDLKGPYFQR